VILSEVTGQDTAAYAQDRLFDPLGIARPRWERSPQREAVGGFGLELTPRDLAKFGLLYLREGEWDGERLLPRPTSRTRRPTSPRATRPATPTTATSGG
jgi:CubicO group peptidase (beta-lactamase class C family)